jgi:hypothetical protein
MDLSCINAWIADALELRMWLKHYIFRTQRFVDAISAGVGDGKLKTATHAN